MSGSDGSANQSGGASDTFSASSFPPLSFGTGTMAMLISLQSQSASGSAASPSQSATPSDTEVIGKISKTEFENAASGPASASRMPIRCSPNSILTASSLAQSESPSAPGAHGHHHHGHGGGDESQGGGTASRQIRSMRCCPGPAPTARPVRPLRNADGSTTTTITYADGTTIDMTSPAVRQQCRDVEQRVWPEIAICLKHLIKLQSQLQQAAGSTLSAIA